MSRDILPLETSCFVELSNGEKVELVFRPFTLRDYAWIQHEISTPEIRAALSRLDPEIVCKIIWQMLTPESKDQFRNIKFVEYDDEKECAVETKILGYKKLLHSFATPVEMLKAFNAYSESESLNQFFPDLSKKKVLTPES